ncbi:MAG: tetratricopeptide repeat protein [Bacteroidota bacterium]|nr:tetratricopeptide repeat protein [Bacteroidota bacterium]
MNESRLNILLQYLKEEPEDPFNIYAVAMEYMNIDVDKMKLYFDRLLEKHEGYLPTYYHAAKFYAQIDKEHAESIYKKGIALAQSLRNNHALRELKSAYNEFLYDEED